jgi:hypothetical protein
MQNLPHLLDSFPLRDDKALFEMLQFTRKAPLAQDYWQVLKGLYKQTETAVLANPAEANTAVLKVLATLIYRIDQTDFADLKSQYPTQATLGYMKRRARRCLRILGVSHPTVYTQVATQVLSAYQDAPVMQIPVQWVTADILYGQSRRCRQTSNGMGNYVFEANKLNLKQAEERFPAIWDEQLNFVRDLLEKEMPWQIYEFAVRVLERNQIQLPALADTVLQRFFASPSVWLKRTAVHLAYQTYTYQGLKPAVFAGMWLFASVSLRKKIDEITRKRSKQDKDWQKEFASQLADYTVGALKRGNRSRRILQAVEHLQANHPKALELDDVLPIAPALLQSPYESLQEIAMAAVKKVKKEDVRQWLEALGLEQNKRHKKLYERMSDILWDKFKNVNNIDRREIEKYVFNDSIYVCDFGWRLSEKVYTYYLYRIWSKFGNFQFAKKIKLVHFYNTITTQYGAEAFMKYYKQSFYNLTYYKTEAFAYLWEHASDKIKNFIVKQYAKNFKEYPLNNLAQLSKLPEEVRNQIFEDALPDLKGKNLFDYYWYVNNALSEAKNNEWIATSLGRLFGVAHIPADKVYDILSYTFEHSEISARFLQLYNEFPREKRQLFVNALSGNYQFLTDYATVIPSAMLAEALQDLSLETILQIITNSPEENWLQLKDSIYPQLRQKQIEAGFWKDVLERILGSEQGQSQLGIRLLQDERFFDLFLTQRDTSVIDLTEPDYEEVLTQWAERNPDLFPMSSGELFRICIHKLPTLRAFGLRHAKALGISLIFALQLFESDLPEAVQEAENHFNSLTEKSDEEQDAVLALIDSPNKVVRAFGLSFLKIRQANFQDRPHILAFLSEHADQTVQETVARQITEKGIATPFVQRFDKEMLRMKNRARKAKEMVKERLEQNLQIDAETLLELARSANKREAEWAIEQLTKKALTGEEIAGFVVEAP